MGIACDISEEPQHEGTQNPEQGTLKHRRPSSPGGARIPGRHNCQKHGALHPIRGAAPDRGHYTRYGALHPIWGTAPDLGHCTRYGALHPNRRGVLPTDRVQRPNTQEQTRNWQTEPLPHHNQPGQPPALGRIAPRQHKSDRTPLHALLGTASGSMGAAPAATYRANMRMKGRTRPPTGNDAPVSAGNAPSPRPRWLQYRSAFPVRRYGHPQCRRLGPCR